MQSLERLPLDVLHIRFVVSLVHNVAKRCMPVIVGRKLAPCCVGRDSNVGSDDETASAMSNTCTSGKNKVRAIECYFGEHSTFPSAMDTGQS